MRDDELAAAAKLLADPAADPAAVVAAFERAARRVKTRCGDGRMVWHVFGDGPAFVLLHGGHGTWLHWLKVIAPLATRYRVLVPDMPGFGDSADPGPFPDEGVALSDVIAAPVVEGLTTLLGRGHVSIAGFSFGGVVAARAAAMLAGRLDHLVIIGAMGFGFRLGPPPPLRKVRNVEPDELAQVHRANLAAMMFADPAKIDPLAVHIQALNVPRARTPSRLVSRSTALVEALPRVDAPVTAIYGEHDVVAFQHDERWQVLSRHSAGARQHVLAGIGHWTQYEAASEVSRLMLTGLAVPGRVGEPEGVA